MIFAYRRKSDGVWMQKEVPTLADFLFSTPDHDPATAKEIPRLPDVFAGEMLDAAGNVVKAPSGPAPTIEERLAKLEAAVFKP